jgi:hypothetical protein
VVDLRPLPDLEKVEAAGAPRTRTPTPTDRRTKEPA